MKVGIISFAHMHAVSYAEHLTKHADVELTAIWDEDIERGSMMAERFNCEYYSNLTSFLQTDLAAVVVCSENANHKKHVIEAAKAKKHVLCEKPISTDVMDAQEMIDICKDHGVILQVAFPVRFVPAVQKVREVIRSGVLGEIVAVDATNHGQMPGGWFVQKDLSGGGAAVDHIVHVMDLIRWMLDEEVKNVYAELDTRFYDIDVEDCGIVTLELESGTIVTIDPSWSRPKTFPTWGDVTMEIVGVKGKISLDAFKQHLVLFNDQQKKVQHIGWGDDMDLGLVNDFIDCIQGMRIPSVTGEDGLRTVEVVQAAYQSAKGKSTITLIRE
ncbi:dehydrogenase [Bacillus sp. HMSC76G11]|uniref:Gfo/Idh/MocA family protein n=1 Tax=Metabacillus idriensis TaxID=324768 RepID=UPI0008A8673B|nr:Gfo/Idh/MocA family oxidoreductase [Metabacillus idriensis]OHR70665.1 dehydrogenase [Bacillus sp. HMSC76G11]